MTRVGDKKQCRRHLTNQYAEKVSAQQNVGVPSSVLEGKDELSVGKVLLLHKVIICCLIYLYSFIC